MTENAYTKHEERQKKLNDLVKDALSNLVSELRIDIDSLLRIMLGLQGIDPDLGRRIDELWQLRKGKMIPAPKAEVVPEKKFEPPKPKPIEAPEVEKKCIQFGYEDALYDDETNNEYMSIDHIDSLPEFGDKEDYEYAMKKIRRDVNLFFAEYFVHKGKFFTLKEADDVEPNVLYNDECPKFRTYEFVIVDLEDNPSHRWFIPGENAKYYFKYGNGRIIEYYPKKGRVPWEEFASTLKMTGLWES